MEEREHEQIRQAEGQFRAAVQAEQAELMAAGAGRVEATEILLSRLRRSTDQNAGTPSTATATTPNNTTIPPPGFSPSELAALVNDHGYSPEDAARALTICHEIRRLEAAGIGGVAAAQELTRRVLDRRDVVGGGGSAGPAGSDAGGGCVARQCSDGVPEICGGGGMSADASGVVDNGSSNAGGGGSAVHMKSKPESPAGGGARRSIANSKAVRNGRCCAADGSASSLKATKSVDHGSDSCAGKEGGVTGRGTNEEASMGGVAEWPLRLAGRKRQHASTNVSMFGRDGMGGFANNQSSRGGQGGVGDQGMFPAPSPPRAAGLNLLASRENGHRFGARAEQQRDACPNSTARRSTVSSTSSALPACSSSSSSRDPDDVDGARGDSCRGHHSRGDNDDGRDDSNDHLRLGNNGRSDERIGRSGDGVESNGNDDMMDVTSPLTMMPASKRPRYHNGHNTCTTTNGNGGETAMFQRDFHHIQQQQQQQQQHHHHHHHHHHIPGQVPAARGVGGGGGGTRDSHPRFFVEQQEQQLQNAFHQLGVRQQNTPSTPPRMSSVQPKRPRGSGDDPSHTKRPRNG